MDASIAALLGALIGAGAGVVGQLLTAAQTARGERRRLAVESGFREWEAMQVMAEKLGRPSRLYPPVLYVHYNHELMRMIDSRDGLTPAKYAALAARRDEIRQVIEADTERRRQEMAAK
jgi:hypothetical protein